MTTRWTVWYETRGTRPDGRAYTYATQTLTPYHARLRAADDTASTRRYDRTVDWPLGLYAEIIHPARQARR